MIKKISIGITIVLVVIGIVVVNAMKEKNEIAVSTPITGRVVVIDAGHGKPDEGAVGYMNTTEQKINLEISQKLQNIVEQSGASAVITRATEDGIYSENANTIRSKKVSDIKNRVKIINQGNTDIMVSIHLNKFSDPQYKGWQVFYQENNPESKRLAQDIQNALNLNINKESERQPKPIEKIYVMDNIKIPGVIIECGFISNPEETKLLKKQDYQDKIAWGIYFGIQEYFRGE